MRLSSFIASFCLPLSCVLGLLLGGGFAPAAWGQPKAPKVSKTKFAQVAIQKTSKHCNRVYRIQVHTLNVVEAPAALKPVVEAQLHSWLRWGLEAETSTASSPEVWAQEELLRHEKQDCETDKDVAQTPWERTLTVKHFFEDERYLSLSFEFVAFEGGAHENRKKQFVTWEKESKTPLTLAALWPEMEPFMALAEDEFRQARKLKPEDDFEEHGYWFDKGRFRLSEQFAFSECGLLLYYNPYEVAAYAVGPIEIFIPFAKLKTLSKLPLPSKSSTKALESCPNAPPPPPRPTPQRAPAKMP